MYEELIDRLRTYANDGTDELRNEAADAIERLADENTRLVTTANGLSRMYDKLVDEMPDGWIPATERLPEPGQYLVCKKYDHGYGVYHSLQIVSYTNNLNKVDKYDFPGKRNKRPGWFDYDSEYGHFETGYNIIAWMPLPEPPKEGEGWQSA